MHQRRHDLAAAAWRRGMVQAVVDRGRLPQAGTTAQALGALSAHINGLLLDARKATGVADLLRVSLQQADVLPDRSRGEQTDAAASVQVPVWLLEQIAARLFRPPPRGDVIDV